MAPTTGRNLPAEQAAHACVLFEAGHCEQTDAPDCDEKVPIPQVVHVASELAASSCEYLPVAHSVHAPSESAPAMPEYFPAAQLTQALIEVAPSSAEYFPLTHRAHDVEAASA